MATSIFVAGTGQHSGKTLVSLGLMAALIERGYRVHYMKPVGQHAVKLDGDMVDEDVALINSVFQLSTPPKAGNPVTIPPGFTRQFLTNGADTEVLRQRIRIGFQTVAKGADIVIVEGTGHAGVGSVLGLGNAEVAGELGSHVIIVTGGGIGQPIDEFALNRACFAAQGVPIAGVIPNKVQPAKVADVAKPLHIWFDRQRVRLLGILPYEPVLSETTLGQVVAGTGAEIISGQQHMDKKIGECIIGAAPPHRLMKFFQPKVLVIMPGDRDDLLLAAFSSYCGVPEEPRTGAAVCLTGGLLPSDNILRIIRSCQMPVIASEQDTYALASQISDLVAKITPTDQDKLKIARQIVAEQVDIDAIEQAVCSG